MFTIKYQTYNPSSAQQSLGKPGLNDPINYDRCEQLHGPFSLVSQEMEDGYVVVYAHRGDDPGMTFGPERMADRVAGEPQPPRSTLYVMNENGATIATYHL